MNRIIICGGRDFSDKELFYTSLDSILYDLADIELISGHASGADSLAEEYANLHNYPVKVFRPEWSKYGRGAGPIRNKQMLEYACCESPVIIAFWNGKSKGTGNMLHLASEANVRCHIVRYSKEEGTHD